MNPIQEVIIEKSTQINPIWLMRQAGRYLPEFREIRKENQNFIKLCLNEKLVPEITLQPLNRFNLDAAIIFSDILMLPYGIGQEVKFQKNFGPKLGDYNETNVDSVNDKDFTERLLPVYNSINKVANDLKNKNKDVIGFVGAPWTLLVYMLNRHSPKNDLDVSLNNIENNKKIIKIIIKFLKIHIKNQIESGAQIIQIFDSWAGLAKKEFLGEVIYDPNAELVEYVKSLNVPVICFPREIENYTEFVNEVSPSVISLDYNVNINKIVKKVKIPTQGNLDPKILLTDKENLRNHTLEILNNFKEHPHIFNLGHGVLPQTDPNMVDYLVNLVKDY